MKPNLFERKKTMFGVWTTQFNNF